MSRNRGTKGIDTQNLDVLVDNFNVKMRKESKTLKNYKP